MYHVHHPNRHRRIGRSGQWHISTPGGTQKVSPVSHPDETLQTQFLKDITQDTAWKEDAQTAIDAARIGLTAERSVAENQRIQISDLT